MAHGITSRDEMFSVRKAPWHGLGKIVQEAPTVAEAIRLANLDWEVYTDPLFTKDGTPVEACAVRRKDTNEVVGDSVGAKWRPLQNAEAFDWFSPFVESGLASLETAGSLFAGRRVWVLAKLNRPSSEITPGDVVDKFLLLSNSHDGSLAVRCGYTPVRVVCNNTLTLAHTGTKTDKPALLRLRHTASLKAGLDEAQRLVAEADAEFEKSADLFRQLARRCITGAEFRDYVRKTLDIKPPPGKTELSAQACTTLEQVIANLDENRGMTRELWDNFQARQAIEAQAHEVIGAQLLDVLTNNLEAGRGMADFKPNGPTWWHAYNAITEHLTHQRGRSTETRLDQSWFGAGAAINRAALANAINGSGIA